MRHNDYFFTYIATSSLYEVFQPRKIIKLMYKIKKNILHLYSGKAFHGYQQNMSYEVAVRLRGGVDWGAEQKRG